MRFAGSRLGSPWGRGRSCPPDHHSPPEAAHQVPIELAVNPYCSCHLRGSGLHAAAVKTGPKQKPAPGRPCSASCPSPSPGPPLGWQTCSAPLPAAHLQGAWAGALLLPPKLPFRAPANPITCRECSEQAGTLAGSTSQQQPSLSFTHRACACLGIPVPLSQEQVPRGSHPRVGSCPPALCPWLCRQPQNGCL